MDKLKNFLRDFDDDDWAGSYASKCAELCAEYVKDLNVNDDWAASNARKGFLMGFLWATQVFADFTNLRTQSHINNKTQQ